MLVVGKGGYTILLSAIMCGCFQCALIVPIDKIIFGSKGQGVQPLAAFILWRCGLSSLASIKLDSSDRSGI